MPHSFSVGERAQRNEKKEKRIPLLKVATEGIPKIQELQLSLPKKKKTRKAGNLAGSQSHDRLQSSSSLD
ncbi:MAG TPA: hypothetical protein DCP63_13585 [Bacteroidetes bacterium]|nr:hypothetical protein [Bacteroidota bacterium]